MWISVFKRGMSVLLTAGLIFSLMACDTDQSVDSQNGAVPSEKSIVSFDEDILPKEAGKILIAYFSLWDNAPWGEVTDSDSSASVVVDENDAFGTNAYVAQMIQKEVGGDLQAIITAEPYPADFEMVTDINHQEESRELSGIIENMDQYDTVFVGYPVWATSLPQAVRTFLTEYDFSDKTVIPFCTHDGYGAGRSFDLVSELAVGARTMEGIAIEASDVPEAQTTISQWLSELDLSIDRNQQAQEEKRIRISIDAMELEGVLYNSLMAEQFVAQLPQSIPM